MALYVYLKSSSSPRGKGRISLFWHYLPFGLISLGIISLANVVLPLVFYELRSNYFQSRITSPVLGETAKEVNYADPRNWFPLAPQLSPRPSKITHYSLSIPKLKIEEAVVQVGGENLMANLIQYPGTALPGQWGNAVIFGHSVLPQFFNPQNYKTIFSTLPELEKGDEILVNFDGVFYRYRVEEIAETSPEDLTILEQRYNEISLTLITCVPPGTYLRRLIIKAKLISN